LLYSSAVQAGLLALILANWSIAGASSSATRQAGWRWVCEPGTRANDADIRRIDNASFFPDCSASAGMHQYSFWIQARFLLKAPVEHLADGAFACAVSSY
jgi:hypothetical protein